MAILGYTLKMGCAHAQETQVRVLECWQTTACNLEEMEEFNFSLVVKRDTAFKRLTFTLIYSEYNRDKPNMSELAFATHLHLSH